MTIRMLMALTFIPSILVWIAIHIPKNTGKELEDLSAKGQLMAHIKVKNGYGILKEITAVK